jgi:glutamate/tyrosine decarboxylase-like PLP-dependent enzyme
MTAAMLGGDAVAADDSARQVVGTVTSGGTESILLAMRPTGDWARATGRIARPELIVPGRSP